MMATLNSGEIGRKVWNFFLNSNYSGSGYDVQEKGINTQKT